MNSASPPPASSESHPAVVVLIPCLNEEVTVGRVVEDFRKALPGARICVFDNASTDGTVAAARRAGAEVYSSPNRGKGNVVRHMFDVIRADYYLLVDGDGTYPAEAAPELLETAVKTGCDMLVGIRLTDFSSGAFRPFHHMGNRFLANLISGVFQVRLTDVLSGYRIFSRAFVRTVPVMSRGFEVETELTLRAAARGYKIQEHPIRYSERPAGSFSKLNTVSDGILIMRLLAIIMRDYKPLTFFGSLALVVAGISILAGLPPIMDFVRHGEVYHLPRAVLAAALGIVSVVLLTMGVLLHSIRNYHNENLEMWRKVMVGEDRPR